MKEPSILERYIRQEEWSSIVRDLKESIDDVPYTIERIAQEILRYVRYTRIRQYNLFTQRRGEEFDHMMASLEEMGFDLKSVREIVEQDAFWQMTLDIADD
jgi:hypothetical protein